MVSNCGGYPIGAIVPGHEHGGRMQYAPTRMSDNGRCRSFAPKMFSNDGGCPIGAIVPCREHRGRMQYAPTRTFDNGRCRSFASEMFFDCGGCLSGAIVLGPEHRGRMQYAPTRMSDNGRCRSFAPEMFSDMCARRPLAGRVGAYCIRPIKWPRRGQIRRRRLSFVRPRNVFRLRRIPVGRYCSRP